MDERRERDPDTGEHIYVGTGISDIFGKIAPKITGKTAKKLASKAAEKGMEKIGEKTGQLIGEKFIINSQNRHHLHQNLNWVAKK